MAMMCFAVLGAFAGWSFKWPGLFFIVSILALAIGVEGAVHNLPFAMVVTNAVLMLVVVEVAFLASALLWERGSKLFLQRKA